MLEQESARIIETLTRHTIGTRHSVLLAEVLASDAPRPVKTYLRQEVYQWLAEDVAGTPHFQRVQASTSAVARHLELFLRATAEGYVFTRPQFLTLLESAVHFALNYLCRPQRTLRSLLFEHKAYRKKEDERGNV